MSDEKPADGAEQARIATMIDDHSGWRKFGPYLSDRAWGTVREDYSADGNAWQYLPYKLSRFKAYRWGEDGIAGVCDRYQVLCFSWAFWNEQDDHIKERFYGVDPYEGNHGEDVKEYYFHVDNTPTHSYMAMRYKYPHAAFPYRELVEENQRRQGQGPEFELADTGVFAENRYFDIVMEFAKENTEDWVACATIENCGPDDAVIHVMPHLWYRNTWSFGAVQKPQPRIERKDALGTTVICATDARADVDTRVPVPQYRLGNRYLSGDASMRAVFTDNETNAAVVFGEGNGSKSTHTKDGIDRAVVL
jgi:hypothetical protein